MVKRTLLDFAIADLKLAKTINYHDDEMMIPMGAYHCQQAAEKILKFYLQSIGKRFPKTHDIDELLDLTEDKDLESILREHATKLTHWESESRYNANFFTTVQEISRKLLIIQTLLTVVVNKLHLSEQTQEFK